MPGAVGRYRVHSGAANIISTEGALRLINLEGAPAVLDLALELAVPVHWMSLEVIDLID